MIDIYLCESCKKVVRHQSGFSGGSLLTLKQMFCNVQGENLLREKAVI